MATKAPEVVSSIALNELKTGQVVSLDDGNLYYVVRKGQNVRLCPVDCCHYKQYNIYGLENPTIDRVYGGNAGNCIKVRKGVC